MSAAVQETQGKFPANARSEHLAWLWFAIGIILLPFAAWQTVISVAAWLAPIFRRKKRGPDTGK